jgi:hypothetical protein
MQDLLLVRAPANHLGAAVPRAPRRASPYRRRLSGLFATRSRANLMDIAEAGNVFHYFTML